MFEPNILKVIISGFPLTDIVGAVPPGHFILLAYDPIAPLPCIVHD